MPMMRRGPLDRYSAEWVLRQANAHEVEGSIEFQTDRPITIYFDAGMPYAAEPGIDLTDAVLAELPTGAERDARDQLVDLLSAALVARSGWYFHDPLGQHPSRGAWRWETATLLMDIRSRAHATETRAAWADRTIGLRDGVASTVTLGSDAWAVVVELSGTAHAGDLRARLGWSTDRIAAALSEIEDRGVLDGPPPARTPGGVLPPPPPGTPATSASGHHTGPLSPPPRTALLQRRSFPLRRSGL